MVVGMEGLTSVRRIGHRFQLRRVVSNEDGRVAWTPDTFATCHTGDWFASDELMIWLCFQKCIGRALRRLG